MRGMDAETLKQITGFAGLLRLLEPEQPVTYERRQMCISSAPWKCNARETCRFARGWPHNKMQQDAIQERKTHVHMFTVMHYHAAKLHPFPHVIRRSVPIIRRQRKGQSFLHFEQVHTFPQYLCKITHSRELQIHRI